MNERQVSLLLVVFGVAMAISTFAKMQSEPKHFGFSEYPSWSTYDALEQEGGPHVLELERELNRHE